jgi:hypothetical protein
VAEAKSSRLFEGLTGCDTAAAPVSVLMPELIIWKCKPALETWNEVRIQLLRKIIF